MIEETIWSQAPNQVLMALPPIDPAKQLLPRSFCSALYQLRSCHCSRLQSYRHSVGRADDPTCPDCRSTDHTVAHLFRCPTHPTDLAYVDGTPPGRSIPGRAQTVQRPAHAADRFRLLSFITFIPPRSWRVGRLLPGGLAVSSLASSGTTSSSSHPSPHFISPVVRGPSILSANQQQQQEQRHLRPYCIAFLTELFNLSVAGVDISAIWKN